MPTQNSTLPLDANGKPYHRTWLVLTLLVGTFTTFITQTLLTTAFPTLMTDFHISATAVQWLTTGFMLIMGIMIPVSAWLLTRINSKYLYLTAMVIFGLGTTLAYFAVNFQMLLIARMIQAMGSEFPHRSFRPSCHRSTRQKNGAQRWERPESLLV